MSDDQMKKYISIQVTRSRLSLFSRSTCSTITAIFILCVYMILIVPTVHAQDVTPSTSQQETTLSSSDSSENSAADVGMKAASAVATIVYFPFKVAFALGGGIVATRRPPRAYGKPAWKAPITLPRKTWPARSPCISLVLRKTMVFHPSQASRNEAVHTQVFCLSRWNAGTWLTLGWHQSTFQADAKTDILM